MQIIVGSAALEHFFISPRKAKDIDIWIDNPCVVVAAYAREDAKIQPVELLTEVGKYCNMIHYGLYVALPDAVYTIKLSHAEYDIHWEKTISDIIYLKQKGCKVIPELYSKLKAHWKTIHGDKAFLSLKKTKSEFFDDYVPYEYDHDLLHEIVAKDGIPVYTKLLKDNQEVMLNHTLFLTLPKEEQLRLFREEIYVIALERWIIPSKFRIPKVVAYRKALKKTITNLTKNWATQFILDNIEHYVRMDGADWYNNFLNYIGKVNDMHSIIKKVKDKASELGIADSEVEGMLTHSELQNEEPKEDSDWHKKYPQYFEDAVKAYKFSEFLKSIGYNYIEGAGGEGQGDWAHSVIELEGKLFRSDYSYSSYDGYYIDDVWDWQEVQKKTKEVVAYE